MIPRLLITVLLCGVIAGCKTTDTTTTGETREKAEPAQQYVQQNSLGSWVPRRVKKSDAPTTTNDAAERRTLEQMRTDQMMRTMPKDGGG